MNYPGKSWRADRSVVYFVIILFVMGIASVHAGLNSPALVNPSFEDPALADGTNSNDINVWYDGIGYTFTSDDGAASHPETPYGDNWSEFGQRRWMYQQIGTYEANMDIEISFLMGARSDKGPSPVVVGLLVGGNPALAADLNTQFYVADFGNSANPLVGIVGSTLIVTSSEIAPFSGTVLATSEQTITLSTGTGYTVGDPLWVQFYCPLTSAGRMLIDNIVVEDMSSTDPIAVNPAPGVNALYVDPAEAIEWEVLNGAGPTFDINIGTTSACNEIVSGFGTGSVMSYTPAVGLLDYAAKYFWRVDVTDGGTEYPGTVWHFTTGGKATEPVPTSGGTADRSAGTLSWSGDVLIASYDVYFGLPGDLQFVGNYTMTGVSFGDLATAVGQSVLAEGTYQWRVDTLDGSDAVMIAGDVWDVIIPEVEPVVIENFDSYIDTSEMLANWTAGGGATLTFEVFYNSMRLDYSGTSDATLAFSPAQSWTATGMDTFVVSFLGIETNTAADISLTVSDGTTSATVNYPRSDATTISWWQKWYIRLSDFSDAGVAINNITSVKISVASGSGTLRIDDLRLEVPGCIAAFQPLGDLNKDCQVTIADLIMLAGDWLMKDFTVSPDAPNDDLLLAHYEFNEISGGSASDSTSNNYHAAVTADDPGIVWNTSGYDSGCIELDNSVEVTIPAAVFNSVTNEVTISMWINGDAADYPDKVNQFIFAAGSTTGDKNDWDKASWKIDNAEAYGGQWNHYAAVKNAATGVMSVYHNGILVGQTTSATAPMEGTLAGDSVLSMARLEADANPKVRIDDLRIYGYALLPSEIASLAGGSVIQPIEPIYTEYDLDDDGFVSLPDFAIIAQDWLEEN